MNSGGILPVILAESVGTIIDLHATLVSWVEGQLLFNDNPEEEVVVSENVNLDNEQFES